MSAPDEPSTPLRIDRRIALVKPASVEEEEVTHAMQLFDSILWAFRGTTRSNWTTVPPEAAQVIVVHQGDPDKRIATWKAGGKLVIEIATAASGATRASRALVYPFRAAQALALLERLDAELDATEDAHRPAASRNSSARNRSHNAWSFVETLRTIGELQNSEAWLVARDSKVPVLWLRADGAMYLAEQSTVQAIRRGTLNLAGLELQKGLPPPGSPAARAGSELSWFAGYHASAELSPWLDANSSYKVTRWPNFGLIRPLPSHIRVAAALASIPAQLCEIAARARVSMEEATRTLNALAVAGAIVAVDSRTTTAAVPRTTAAEPRGGFSSFLRNMRRHLGLETWT